MNRWKAVTAWAGYLVLGMPVVPAVPALVETFAEFGIRGALSAVPAAMCALVPALLWLRYTRRRPTRIGGCITWCVAGVLIVLVYLMTPLWFWSGLVSCVLVSEVARVAVVAVTARISSAGGHEPVVRVDVGGAR